jgi:hypothetical protein
MSIAASYPCPFWTTPVASRSIPARDADFESKLMLACEGFIKADNASLASRAGPTALPNRLASIGYS